MKRADLDELLQCLINEASLTMKDSAIAKVLEGYAKFLREQAAERPEQRRPLPGAGRS